MPRKRTVIATRTPLGVKLNRVMAERGIEADYAGLAAVFEVTPASAREWVQYGRMAKKHFPRLVEWSGRSLDWWFDSSADPQSAAPPGPMAGERSVGFHERAWPFVRVSADDYAALSDLERAEIEGFVLAYVRSARQRRAANSTQVAA